MGEGISLMNATKNMLEDEGYLARIYSEGCLEEREYDLDCAIINTGLAGIPMINDIRRNYPETEIVIGLTFETEGIEKFWEIANNCKNVHLLYKPYHPRKLLGLLERFKK